MARQQLPKALEAYVQQFKPKQEQIVVSFRMNPAEHEEFRAASKQDGVLTARLMRALIRRYLDERKGISPARSQRLTA